eukprot:TRINITY_DN1547_c0_g1_i4.p1 TRINITY_DN1547_c0_g1~~TRINITY_DN1547_c0_g1_i4.p1  ORF type:complete len:155 (-),score=17.15 TRINITY_DN1547_c0_g1_i4:112-576(-)
MIFPIIGDTLVKGTIILFRNIGWIPQPQGLLFVQLFPVVLLHFLLFLVLVLGFFFIVVVVFDLLDLRIITLVDCFLRGFSFVIRHLFLLGGVQGNGILNELGMFLHQILDGTIFQEISLIFLQVQDDLGSTSQRLIGNITLDGEVAACFPRTLR